MKFQSKILKLANNNVTVALSMGVDSLAVCHFLKTRYPRMNVKAIHFNHNLRSQNFDMEAKAIKFCAAMQIPLTVKRRDRYTQKGESEAELRSYRLKAFTGHGFIVTGHHLDDACESYLMNCLKGHPDYLPIPVKTEFDNFTIIRPFILTTKESMEQYIIHHDLGRWVVEDETNTDENYRRNWVRHTMLPEIKENGYNLQTTVRKRYGNQLFS